MELAQAFFSSEEAFPVPFADGWQWLGYTRKDNALRKLIGCFTENQDYTLLRSEEQDVPLTFSDFQASHQKTYFLTVECFKGLAVKHPTS